MKGGLRSLVSSQLARNTTALALGTGVAQAIALAAAPVITRLFGPEAFGILGVFTAATQVVIPVAALTYPIAIVLPKSDRDALGIARISLLSSVLVATIVGLALGTVPAKVIVLLGLGPVEPYLLLVPLVIVAAAMTQVGQQWLVRRKRFTFSSVATVLQTSVVSVAKVAGGLLHPSASTLIWLSAASHPLLVGVLLLGFCRDGAMAGVVEGRGDTSLRSLAIRYRDFPLYRAPQVLISVLAQSVPVLMLASLFGAAAAGQYSLGRMVLGAPITLISGSVSSAIYPRLAEAARRREPLGRLIGRSTLALGAIGLIPFGAVALAGPALFEFVFGSAWRGAGIYGQWMSLWLFFAFINTPSVAAIPVLGLQPGLLLYELASTTMKVGALVLGYGLFRRDVVAVALFSIAGLLSYLGLITWVAIASRGGSEGQSDAR